MSGQATIMLWFDDGALDAAQFYCETFPDSEITSVERAASDGAVFAVSFTVCDIPCVSFNGGPAFQHSEAFSFQITTEDQQETDRYWNAIVGNDGQESQCGWCKDKWGFPGRSRLVH